MNTTLSETVASVLDELELNYRHDGNDYIFKSCEEDGDFTFCIIADEEDELLSVICYFPIFVPMENLDRTRCVINGINDKVFAGAFSIDPEDRRPSFRMTNYVNGDVDNKRIIQKCLLQVMGQINHSFLAIAKAMFGNEQFTLTFNSSEHLN